MLFYILLIIAIIAPFLYLKGYNLSDKIISSAIAFLIIGSIFLFAGPFAPTYNTSSIATSKIIAMEDNISPSGSIFLISDKNTYTIFKETEKGIQPETYNSEDVYLKYDDTNPRIEEEYIITNIQTWWDKYISPINPNYFPQQGTITIYIPSSSITSTFSADLK